MARRIALPLLSVLLLIGAFLSVRLVRKSAEQANKTAALEAENRELRSRLEDALKRSSLPPDSRPPDSPRLRELPDRHPVESGRIASEALAAQQLRESLKESQAAASRLEARIQELETQIDRTTLENRSLSETGADLREQLATTNRVLEAVQNDLKAKNDRLAQSETANLRLREQSNAQSRKTSALAQLSAELQDIHNRREVYLNNVARRYRELADQSRALSGTLENRSDREGASLNPAELSRIQSLITLAEEDLRQLNALNAQALRIQRKLSATPP